MSWVLPVPLLLFAGAVALLPLVSLVHRLTSAPRLGAEAVITASAVIAFVWLEWVRLWLIEQRRCAAARPASWPRMSLRVPRCRRSGGWRSHAERPHPARCPATRDRHPPRLLLLGCGPREMGGDAPFPASGTGKDLAWMTDPRRMREPPRLPLQSLGAIADIYS